MYYFAYGSNMNQDQMLERCPSAIPLTRGLLSGYRLVYDGWSVNRNCSVANIVPDAGSIVWGGIYALEIKGMELLNKFEGYPVNYQQQEVSVRGDNGKSYLASVYLRIGQLGGVPSEEYVQIIKTGAEKFNLPSDYIDRYIVMKKG